MAKQDFDRLGILGTTPPAAAQWDRLGILGKTPPKIATPRKKPRTAARDIEQPSAAEPNEDADEMGQLREIAEGKPTEAERGAPPGPAGTPAPRPGTVRTEEPAWYEPLLKSGASFYQGLTQNTFDETAAGYQWALDKLGLTNSGRSFEENRQRAHEMLSGASKEYPLAHGAGQATAGMAMGAAGPQGALSQGLLQGALSAGSEYADSRSLKEASKAGAIGTATGTLGGWLGNQAAKRFAVVDPVKNLIRRGNMTPDEMVPKGAAPDILRRGGRPVEPVNVLEQGAPRPLPVESYPGGYDPLAAQQMATPLGPPRPLPVPEGGGGVPPEAVAKLLRGSNGKFQKVLPMELDMAPAPRLPSAPSEGAAYTGQWDVNLPPDAPLDFAPKPRVGSAPPIESTPSLPPFEARRIPTGPAEPIELGPSKWDIASSAQRAAATPPGAKVDQLLSAASHVPGLGLPARLGRAGLRMVGGPDVAAREAGVYLNDNARQLARGGFEAAWELGAPGVTGRPVNAQDGEQVAYASSPTLNYALSATLHGGSTGLSPQDEQALTSAVVRGDDKAIAATDFRLRQKYPAYARQVERALRDLNEEER